MNNSNSTGSGIQYWHRMVILLCLGWTVIWIYRIVLTPIYPEIQSTIGPHTDKQMGLIASIYFFAYTGMQIPSGILVDRIGKKAILIPGFSLFAIAAILIGSAKNINMIYLGSLLAGLGTGAYYGSAYSLSGSTIPVANRTFSNAIINSGSAVGMALGLIGSSLLVKTLNVQWNICLYIIAGIILCMTLAFFMVIKTDNETAAPTPEVKTTEVVVDTGDKSPLFSIKMVSAYLLYFATCYGYYMLVTWLPNFLETERGFQGIAIGMSSSLVAFASIPGALFFSRMSDKFQNKRIFTICSLEVGAALMLAFIVLAPSSQLLLVGLLAYGLIGKLAVDPILISHITASASKNRLGTSLTVFNFFGMSSSVVAPFATGVISDAFGSKVVAFYVAVGLLVIGTVVFVLINRQVEVDN